MQTNQSLLNSKLTHIIGNTGTGKTYFVKNQIEEIIKSGKNVIYLSVYDDMIVDSDLLEKVYIKNEDDIENTDIENKNLHIVFDRKNIGEDEANKLANKFILSTIETNKLSENTYLVLDDCQTYRDDVLDKVVKIDSYIVLIHQYIQQLSDDAQFLILNHSEKGVYFNMPKSNIDMLKHYYKENGESEVDSIAELTDHNYVVLPKMTVEDKKTIKEIVNAFFESVSRKDVEKIESITTDNVLFIFYEDKNFIKEDLKDNFDKIKFEGDNNITHIDVTGDWGYVHLIGQMILENQEKVSDKMMITLRKKNEGWIISCVQNMQE